MKSIMNVIEGFLTSPIQENIIPDNGWFKQVLNEVKEHKTKDKGHAVISCQNYNSNNPPIAQAYNRIVNPQQGLNSGIGMVRNTANIKWIGYKAYNVPNGFMSYFGATLNISNDGIYAIYMSADDEGWLYINGKEIGGTSGSWHNVRKFNVKLNKGTYGLTVSVKNYCPKCKHGITMSGFFSSLVCTNPSSLALFVETPNKSYGFHWGNSDFGSIVLQTNTDWKASSSVIDYHSLINKNIDNNIKNIFTVPKKINWKEKWAKAPCLAPGCTQFSVPKISVGQKVSVPKVGISVPKVSVPKVSVPKVSVPKVGISVPKVSVPKVSVPKVGISVPKVTEPYNLHLNTNAFYKIPEYKRPRDNEIKYPFNSAHTDNLINTEHKVNYMNTQNIVVSSKLSAEHKIIDDIKKYWWVGLLAAGHIF